MTENNITQPTYFHGGIAGLGPIRLVFGDASTILRLRREAQEAERAAAKAQPGTRQALDAQIADLEEEAGELEDEIEDLRAQVCTIEDEIKDLARQRTTAPVAMPDTGMGDDLWEGDEMTVRGRM